MTFGQAAQGDRTTPDLALRHSEIITRPSGSSLPPGAILGLLLQSALGFCGIVASFAWVRTIDHERLASSEAILADAPRDVRRPYAETRRESLLRTAYREPPSQPVAAPPATKALDGVLPGVLDKGVRFYRLRCEPCHGSRGGGDGLAASMIKPKPRTFADSAWQASVTDEVLARAILKGGASVGKSYMMPASPDLHKKKELTDTLVRLVRSFGEAPASPP